MTRCLEVALAGFSEICREIGGHDGFCGDQYI